MSSSCRGLAAGLIGVAACALYLGTLSNHFNGDSIEYALAIESMDPALLLDPYHPLLHPVGLLFYRLWQFAGWTGKALLPLQILNALAGGLCAGLLAAIADKLSGSAALAAATGLGFAVSGGLWMLSVEAEFVTLPLALMLIVLWATLCISPATAVRNRYPILLGGATAVAVTGYVSSALLAPVVMADLLSDRRLEPAVRRRHCMVYAASLLLLLVPVYLAFLAAWSEGDWRQVPSYFFGRSYGRFTPFSIPHGVYAFLRSLALYPNLSLVGTTRDFLAQASPTGRLLFAGYYGLILLAALAPAWLAWRQRRRLWPAERRPLLILGMWTLLFSAFGFYWVPGDQSFWLPVLAAWWLLLVLALTAAQVKARHLAAILAAVAGLAVGNALFEIAPRHDIRQNAAYQVAQQTIAHTDRQAILLARADDITGLYLAYWGDRQVVYVSDEVKNLAELSAFFISAQDTYPLVVADSDGRRVGWWLALLESGSWLSSVPDWHTGSGLVLELSR